MEIDPNVFAWLSSLNIINPSLKIEQTSPTSFPKLPSRTIELLLGGKYMDIILTHLQNTYNSFYNLNFDYVKDLSQMKPIDDKSEYISHSIKYFNWNIISETLSHFGLNYNQNKIIELSNGNRAVLSDILTNIYSLCNELLKRVPIVSKQHSLGKTLQQQQSITTSSINLNNIDITKAYGDCTTLLEFILISLCKNFEVNPRQAVALLSNNRKYLSILCNKGIKGDFTKIENWLTDLIANKRDLFKIMQYSNDGVNICFSTLGTALCSKQANIVVRVASILIEIQKEIQIDWDWLCTEGIDSMIFSISKHDTCREVLLKYLFEFIKRNIFDFGVEIKKRMKLRDARKKLFEFYTSILTCIPRLHNEIYEKELTSLLYELCLSEQHDITCALSLLSNAWVLLYPINDSLSNSIITLITHAIHVGHSESIYSCAIAMMFYLIDNFSKSKYEQAPQLYKQTVQLFINEYDNEHKREIFLQQFDSFLNKNHLIPIDILLTPYLDKLHSCSKHITLSEIVFFFKFLEHPRIESTHVIKVIHMMLQITLYNFYLSSSANIVLSLIFDKKYIHELCSQTEREEIYRMFYQYINTVIDLYVSDLSNNDDSKVLETSVDIMGQLIKEVNYAVHSKVVEALEKYRKVKKKNSKVLLTMLWFYDDHDDVVMRLEEMFREVYVKPAVPAKKPKKKIVSVIKAALQKSNTKSVSPGKNKDDKGSSNEISKKSTFKGTTVLPTINEAAQDKPQQQQQQTVVTAKNKQQRGDKVKQAKILSQSKSQVFAKQTPRNEHLKKFNININSNKSVNSNQKTTIALSIRPPSSSSTRNSQLNPQQTHSISSHNNSIIINNNNIKPNTSYNDPFESPQTPKSTHNNKQSIPLKQPKTLHKSSSAMYLKSILNFPPPIIKPKLFQPAKPVLQDDITHKFGTILSIDKRKQMEAHSKQLFEINKLKSAREQIAPEGSTTQDNSFYNESLINSLSTLSVRARSFYISNDMYKNFILPIDLNDEENRETTAINGYNVQYKRYIKYAFRTYADQVSGVISKGNIIKLFRDKCYDKNDVSNEEITIAIKNIFGEHLNGLDYEQFCVLLVQVSFLIYVKRRITLTISECYGNLLKQFKELHDKQLNNGNNNNNNNSSGSSTRKKNKLYTKMNDVIELIKLHLPLHKVKKQTQNTLLNVDDANTTHNITLNDNNNDNTKHINIPPGFIINETTTVRYNCRLPLHLLNIIPESQFICYELIEEILFSFLSSSIIEPFVTLAKTETVSINPTTIHKWSKDLTIAYMNLPQEYEANNLAIDVADCLEDTLRNVCKNKNIKGELIHQHIIDEIRRCKEIENTKEQARLLRHKELKLQLEEMKAIKLKTLKEKEEQERTLQLQKIKEYKEQIEKEKTEQQKRKEKVMQYKQQLELEKQHKLIEEQKRQVEEKAKLFQKKKAFLENHKQYVKDQFKLIKNKHEMLSRQLHEDDMKQLKKIESSSTYLQVDKEYLQFEKKLNNTMHTLTDRNDIKSVLMKYNKQLKYIYDVYAHLGMRSINVINKDTIRLNEFKQFLNDFLILGVLITTDQVSYVFNKITVDSGRQKDENEFYLTFNEFVVSLLYITILSKVNDRNRKVLPNDVDNVSGDMLESLLEFIGLDVNRDRRAMERFINQRKSMKSKDFIKLQGEAKKKGVEYRKLGVEKKVENTREEKLSEVRKDYERRVYERKMEESEMLKASKENGIVVIDENKENENNENGNNVNQNINVEVNEMEYHEEQDVKQDNNNENQ